MTVKHSSKSSIKSSEYIVLEETLTFERHSYNSNWLVSNCRYDVLLGIPWHIAHSPDINCKERVASVDRQNINHVKKYLPIM